MMNKEKYLLNNKPISARGLIKKVDLYNSEFKASSIKRTSMAAEILREVGFTIEDNLDMVVNSSI